MASLMSKSDGKLQEQFLVQWAGQTPLEATWEEKQVLLQDYPTFDLEVKFIFDRHGNDTRLANEGNMRQEASEKESQIVDQGPKETLKGPKGSTINLQFVDSCNPYLPPTLVIVDSRSYNCF